MLGAVVLNNTLTLGVLLLLVAMFDLPFGYAPELLSILAVVTAVGLLSRKHTTLRLWFIVPIALLFPGTPLLYTFLKGVASG